MVAIEGNRRKWLKRIGLIIGLVWASLWTVFVVASAWSEGFGPVTSEAVFASAVLVLGVLFLWGSLVIAWKRGLVGGILLVIAGLLVVIGYPWAVASLIDPVGIILIVVFMGLPPMVAGLLFILSWRKQLSGGASP